MGSGGGGHGPHLCSVVGGIIAEFVLGICFTGLRQGTHFLGNVFNPLYTTGTSRVNKHLDLFFATRSVSQLFYKDTLLVIET